MSEVRKRALDEDTSSQEGLEDQSTKRIAKEELHSVERVMVMKLLCPSSIIGAIIGRGGSVLNGFQTATNTTIRISQNNDFFPETNDRVIAITGQPDNVRAGYSIIIDKICEVSLSNDSRRAEGQRHNQPPPMPHDSPGSTTGLGVSSNSGFAGHSITLLCVRVLIPHAASGVVIGRSGANIKQISSATDTRLQLTDASDPYRTNERIVSISGNEGRTVKDAAVQVLELLLANRNVGNFLNVTPSYHIPVLMTPHARAQPPTRQRQGGMMMGQFPSFPPPTLASGLSGSVPNYPSPYYTQGQSQSRSQPPAPLPMSYPSIINVPTPTPAMVTQIGVPDQMVGAIVGKGGLVLKTIIATTGASIKVSQKGEFIPGTNNRSITIEGSQQQVHSAHTEIMSLMTGQQTNKIPF